VTSSLWQHDGQLNVTEHLRQCGRNHEAVVVVLVLVVYWHSIESCHPPRDNGCL